MGLRPGKLGRSMLRPYRGRRNLGVRGRASALRGEVGAMGFWLARWDQRRG
jgi:hypothetical protein